MKLEHFITLIRLFLISDVRNDKRYVNKSLIKVTIYDYCKKLENSEISCVCQITLNVTNIALCLVRPICHTTYTQIVVTPWSVSLPIPIIEIIQ